MACTELDGPDHEGGGRKAFHHRRLGLPDRSLQIFDPFLSYPSTVLGGERAIVINLEHIKTIIKAQEVLLLNFKDPSVTSFVNELQRKIQSQILSFLFHSSIGVEESAIDDTNCIIRKNHNICYQGFHNFLIKSRKAKQRRI
ncbi:hypothetical protein GQ457_04G023200 [Hibiscus cannabinus]